LNVWIVFLISCAWVRLAIFKLSEFSINMHVALHGYV